MIQWNLRRHVTVSAHATQTDLQRPERVTHRVPDSRCLVTAVHHAVGALLVVAGPVGIPVGFIHQLAKAAGVAFPQQVARSLPAENVAGWIAPRSATVLAVAGEKVKEQA